MSIIFITGSSTGLGYATAETLSRNGHTVYARLRNPMRSPQLKQLAKDNHLPITALALDVLDDLSVRKVINNAGIASWGALEETGQSNSP